MEIIADILSEISLLNIPDCTKSKPFLSTAFSRQLRKNIVKRPFPYFFSISLRIILILSFASSDEAVFQFQPFKDSFTLPVLISTATHYSTVAGKKQAP